MAADASDRYVVAHALPQFSEVWWTDSLDRYWLHPEQRFGKEWCALYKRALNEATGDAAVWREENTWG